MQAAPCMTSPIVIVNLAAINLSRQAAVLSPQRPSASRTSTSFVMRATSVNYNSLISVFPAEACEIVGGDACLAEVFPEVKLQRGGDDDHEGRSINQRARVDSDLVEREYLEYNDAKTVFPAEACDDLGGEFCSSEYQRGVY